MSIILNSGGNPQYANYNGNRVQHIRYNDNPVWFEHLQLSSSYVMCVSESAHIYGRRNDGHIYVVLNNIYDRFIAINGQYRIKLFYSRWGAHTATTTLNTLTIGHITGIDGNQSPSTDITIIDTNAEDHLAPGSGLQRRRYYSGPFVVGYNTGFNIHHLN